MNLKRTDKTLIEVGFMLRKGLQDELKAQRHNATGRLSRGLRYHIKNNVLSIMSSVSYWKAVNNPLFAKKPNIRAIERWVSTKGLPINSVHPIFKKLQTSYGKPYSFWTQGNSLRRTDFAGYTANKFKDKIVEKLAPSIGKDVADMIAKQIKQNNPTTNVQKAF
tara:strand:+ start:1270 stop:1761 length:492 start_codon:yes stop_codon:yes gene_type:complete